VIFYPFSPMVTPPGDRIFRRGVCFYRYLEKQFSSLETGE
jgi:hypothetical protein